MNIDIDPYHILSSYNPWWQDKNWRNHDQYLITFYNSIIRRRPRLFHHLSSVKKKGYYGIITIRGPRRVGKTTLLRLLVEHLLDSGVPPRNIFYISLDYEGLKDIRLVKLLEAIAEVSEDEKYIFIDEASMHPEWATALKNISDMGLIEQKRLKIIATGSHSMDIADAANKLAGRQGRLPELFNLGGNLVHFPLRFSEVVEGIKPRFNYYVGQIGIRKVRVRFRALLDLKNGNIPDLIEEVYEQYFSLISELFENYLIHGGYPRVIDNYYKNNGDKIEKALYYELADVLIKDSARLNLNPENLKRILEKLTERNLLSQTKKLHDLEVVMIDEKMKPRKNIDLERYVNYLRSTWSFFFSCREREECVPNYETEVKIYVLDPFIYHSLYSYLRNVDDPFGMSKNMLSDTSFKGQLVESVVASHLIRAQHLFQRVSNVEYSKVLMYGRTQDSIGSKETDFILCVRRKNDLYRFEIEVKYRENPYRGTTQNSKIILTKDKLDVKGSRVYIPTPIFLLLF